VQTGTEGGVARLTVSSGGAVLDPAEVAGLFEPFRRGGTARTATRGAGLGLSIVRAVASAHGGSVQAFPLPTGGLQVRAELPAG
jgi:signal transduction histidine kinase